MGDRRGIIDSFIEVLILLLTKGNKEKTDRIYLLYKTIIELLNDHIFLLTGIFFL